MLERAIFVDGFLDLPSQWPKYNAWNRHVCVLSVCLERPTRFLNGLFADQHGGLEEASRADHPLQASVQDCEDCGFVYKGMRILLFLGSSTSFFC